MITENFDARPMSERVYDEIRRRIEQGDLAPHERLVQEQIAADLSTSRTPVREALSRLAQDGLATWIAGTGYVVTKLRKQEVEEVQRLRKVLEVGALNEAIPHFSQVDLDRLRDVHQRMVDADRATADYVELTRHFHRALVAPCPNQLMLKYVDETWSLPLNAMVIGRNGENHERIDEMISDHRDIIEALESGDPVQAVALLSTHRCSTHHAVESRD